MKSTKDKILDAAWHLIIEKGYVSTTTKEIAVVAHVSEMTLFRHFKQKKDIILYGLDQCGWFPQLQGSALEECTGNLHEELTHFARLLVSQLNTNYIRLLMGLRDPQIFPEIREKMISRANHFRPLLVRYFETLILKGELRIENPDFLADLFMSSLFGFQFARVSFGEKFFPTDLDEYVERTVDTFSKGVSC